MTEKNKDIKKSIYKLLLSREFRAIPIVMLVLLVIGFASGWFGHITWISEKDGPIRETRLGGYNFINPLLDCDPDAATARKELTPFDRELRMLIEDKKKMNWITHVAVYFRDLNTGVSISIDGREKFSPASLVKVPLMIAYLKWAESNPGLLSRKMTFDMPDSTEIQTFKPAQRLVQGKSYTVDELLYRAIVYSDNSAYFLLYSAIDTNILHRVYTDLGLEVPRVRNPDDYMSVVEYVSFFRMLYNASYLSKDMSEKALQYLSEVDFKQGLIGGVPPGTVVAHKFGEKVFGSGEIKQLHDCGIVYYPNHPYLLCVMSRGESFEYLDDTIRAISSLVYEEVDQQHHGH